MGQIFVFCLCQIHHFDIEQVVLLVIVILHTALFAVGVCIINAALEHNVQLVSDNVYQTRKSCWGEIDPINQECLLLQLKKFIA